MRKQLHGAPCERDALRGEHTRLRRLRRTLASPLALAFVLVAALAGATAVRAIAAERAVADDACAERTGAEEAASAEARLTAAVRYLASDELEGRGIGTTGLVAAGDYIAEQFGALGLTIDLVDGGPFKNSP
jgi:hypothetical protein